MLTTVALLFSTLPADTPEDTCASSVEVFAIPA